MSSSVTGLMSRLRSVLQEIQSDKITPRKKAHDDLSLLLENAQLLSTLSSPAGEIRWTHVYDAVCRYLEKEAQKMEKEVTSGKPTPAAKMKVAAGAVAGIWKKVVSKANHGGEGRLTAGVVINHTLNVLDAQRNVFLREYFGPDALKILHKLIIMPHYARRVEEATEDKVLAPKNWKRILETTFQLFSNPPNSLDFMSLALFFHDVLCQSNNYSCTTLPFLANEKRFRQLKELLTSSHLKTCSVDQQVSLLKGINKFMEINSHDCRQQLCSFGEAVLPNVLMMYDSKGSERNRKVVIEFLTLQVTLHHPCGARTDIEGAYFDNEATWGEHLHRIYHSLVVNVIFNQNKSRRTRNNSVYDLPDYHVALAVEVCYQLISSTSTTINGSNGEEPSVTQYVRRDETQAESAPKRRKVEQLGLITLLENLANIRKEDADDQMQVVPWLQIICRLLERHPTFLKDEDKLFSSTLSSLMAAMQECKFSELKSYLFTGLVNLQAAGTEAMIKRTAKEWRQAVIFALNTVTSNNCIAEGHLLIRRVLKSGVVKDLRDLYNYFANNTVGCNGASIRTLICLAGVCRIPDQLSSNTAFMLTQSVTLDNSKSRGRMTLLKWLYDDESEELQLQDSARLKMWKNLMESSPEAIGALLWVLALKQCPKDMSQLLDEKLEAMIKSQMGKCLDQSLAEYELLSFSAEAILKSPQRSLETNRDCNVVLIDEIADKIQGILISKCARDILQLSRKKLAPGELNPTLKDGLSTLNVLVCFISWKETLRVTSESFKRLSEVASNLLQHCCKALELLIQDNACSNEDKTILLKKFRSVLEKFTARKEMSNEIIQGRISGTLVDCLVRQILVLAGRHAGNGDSVNVQASSEDILDMEDELPAELDRSEDDFDCDGINADEDQKGAVVAEMLLFLATLLFSSTRDQSESTLQYQKKLVSCLASLLRQEQQRKDFDIFLKITFDTLAIVLDCSQGDNSLHEEIVHEVSSLLNSIPKAKYACIRKDNFDPDTVSKLLSALELLSRRFGRPCRIEDCNNLVTYVRSFVVLHYKSDFNLMSVKLQTQIVKLIASIVKADPANEWSTWNKSTHRSCSFEEFVPNDSTDGNDVPVGYALFRFLCHDSHQIRTAASEAIQSVFWTNNSSETKCQDFKRLHAHLSYLCSEKANLPRITTLLMTLGPLAENCPLLVREAVTGLLLFYKGLSIPLVLLRRSIWNLASKKYQDYTADIAVEIYLSSMLSYVLKEFLKHNVLSDFPIQLMNCTTLREFLAKYEQIIVPLALWNRGNQEKILKELSAIMHKPEQRLLVHNYPYILSYFLPFLAAKVEDNGRDILLEALGQDSSKVLAKATKVSNLMEQVLTQKRHHTLLNEKIPEILSEVFSRIFDPTAVAALFGLKSTVLMRPNPPYCSELLAKNLVAYFSTVARSEKGEEASLFAYLVELIPDCLQRLVQKLCSVLRVRESTPDAHIRALHGLHLLVKFFEEEATAMANQLPYLTWFLSHSLLVILRDTDFDDVRRSSCVVLREVLTLAVNRNVPGTEQLLIPVRSSMISLAVNDETSRDIALAVLQLITETYGRKCPSEVIKLGHFPDRPLFRHLEAMLTKIGSVEPSLCDTISHFLEVSQLVQSSHLIDSLDCLLRGLEKQMGQLSSMVKTLNDSKGLSEDANDSLLHQLICQLVDLISQPDVSPTVVKAAGQCLGVIGACNLGTLVLKPENVCLARSSVPFDSYIKHIVEWTMDHLIAPDNDTVTAASHALKVLLGTVQGRSLGLSDLGKKYHLTIPFRPEQVSGVASVAVVEDEFRQQVGSESLWCPGSASHNDWIKDIVCNMLSSLEGNCAYKSLMRLCQLQPSFCEKLFPCLVHDILYSCGDGGGVSSTLSTLVKRFFEMHFLSTGAADHADGSSRASSPGPDDATSPHRSSFLTVKSVRVMLNLVRHLRHQPRIDNVIWKQNFWLRELNYLHVAKAALSCSAHFSAILFVDIFCQDYRRNRPNEAIDRIVSGHAAENILNAMYVQCPELGKACQSILFEAYQKLGELDALYGCGTNSLIEGSSRIKHFVEEGKHFKAMGLLDVDLEQFSQEDMVSILFRSGLHRTVNCINGDGESGAKIQEYQYDCAWRLAQWDDRLNDEIEEDDSREASYKPHHSLAIKHLLKNEMDRFETAVDRARRAVCSNLCKASIESSRAVYEGMSSLRSLRELEILSKLLTLQRTDEQQAVLQNLSEYDDASQASFSLSEPIRLQRSIVLEYLPLPVHSRKHLSEASLKLSLSYIGDCLVNNKLQLAWHRLNNLTRNATSVAPNALNSRLKYQESLLLWQSGEKDVAKFVLTDLREKMAACGDEDDKSLCAQVLQTLGSWSAELKSSSSTVILDDYLLRAVEAYESLPQDHSEMAVEAYVAVARYCDEQYKRIVDYMASKEYADKQDLMEKIKTNANDIKNVNAAAREVRTGIMIFEKHANIDSHEIETSQEQRIKYLMLSLSHYGKALARQSRHMVVSRFISLWFTNCQHDDINRLVERLVADISSSNFVPLLYQLAARLTEAMASGHFQRLLSNLIQRCGEQHTFHTVPVLLALINAHADEAIGGGTASKRPSISNGCELDERGKAARRILAKIQSKSVQVKRIVENLESSSTALIKLAYTEAAKSTSAKHKIDASHPLAKIKQYENIPIHTIPLSVRADGDYSRFVGLVSYDAAYEMVGGITAPKKIRCLGTDGRRRTQLVKGKDDLRQDAVMQQVFGLMNTLLKKDKLTNTKRLNIRQYKVVPLSQRSGVLEWCEGTMPISEYLLGSGDTPGAHATYHPKDKLPMSCRKHLDKIQKLYKNEELTRAFVELCNNIRPVLRYFFYENFISAGQHFERQLAYTRSVAASSMVGYILGLGDRHVHNILLDKKTAELVHIDLGVAFEQGKILPTPETIPFRLTRDIVDGFGPSGVEGTFRRSCEATMRVLRENKEEILTILEVLTHDPLYNWSMTPEKAYRIQHGQDADSATRARWARERKQQQQKEEGNKMAERVLLRVAQKLNGFEEGHLMSPEGQVNALIQQARDPSRLCMVFVGWQPYL